MSATEKLSVAALIGVILRRRINRTIDVKWLVENDAYAREIIKISREQKLEDLNEYADHLEQLISGEAKPVAKPVIAPVPVKSMEETAKADIRIPTSANNFCSSETVTLGCFNQATAMAVRG